MKHDLLDMISRLGLDKQMCMPHSPGNCHVFRQEEIFAWTMIKLVHGLTHTGMSDFVAGCKNVIWRAGHDHMMRCLDKKNII